MGFSDIGCYGSEIQTPNLDALAAKGIRFTQFYNGARCCPTRAQLLTGLYAHQTGMGCMEPDWKLPGYRGNINRQCVTLAEALKPAGYRTYMAGKWHVTNTTRAKTLEEKHNWPRQRGFDRYFGTIAGAGSFFTPKTLTRDNDDITDEAQADKAFYYTDAINDATVGFIDDHAKAMRDTPFFAYVAHTAPHWPLHALAEDIKKYAARYKAGWDALRDERHARMKKLGVVDAKWPLSPRTGYVRHGPNSRNSASPNTSPPSPASPSRTSRTTWPSRWPSTRPWWIAWTRASAASSPRCGSMACWRTRSSSSSPTTADARSGASTGSG
ncbi:sulfatase-like hydrolase/transferase [bacterium]|nr:sulfatase-like hydrolase/transferase [bacterium]